MPKNSRTNPVRAVLLAMLLACLCLPVSAGDELTLGGGEVELRGFNTNGERVMQPDDPQRRTLVRWRVGGMRALLNPPLFTIYGFRLKLEAEALGREPGEPAAGGKKALEGLRSSEWELTSPQCLFDQQKCEMRSSSAVRIAGRINGEPCSMGGVGYDVLWRGEERRLVLVIRNAAWMKFSRKLLDDGRDRAKK